MGDCVGYCVGSCVGVSVFVLSLATGAGAGAALGAEAEGATATGALPPSSWATTTTTAHPIQTRTAIRANESMLTSDRSNKGLNVVEGVVGGVCVWCCDAYTRAMGLAKKLKTPEENDRINDHIFLRINFYWEKRRAHLDEVVLVFRAGAVGK
jgi:hypothetical protein